MLYVFIFEVFKIAGKTEITRLFILNDVVSHGFLSS